jgi:hypothetical protein
VRATGTGVTEATATTSLTVAPAATGGFTLTLDPASVTLDRGASVPVKISIARDPPFTGAVALSATGLPTGVTASFAPASATGDSATMTLSASATAATGAATVTIQGTATGAPEHAASLSVTVTSPPPAGSGAWSICSYENILWFGAQDGTGAWTQVLPSGGTVPLSFPSGRGAIAYVEDDGSGMIATTVFFGTTTELGVQGESRCDAIKLGTRTVNGSVAGLTAADIGSVALGGAFAQAIPALGTGFTLNRVFNGTADLIAARVEQIVAGSAVTLTPRKMIIRRGLDPAPGSTLPVLDFGGAEAFDPAVHTLTLSNLGGEQVFASAWYQTVNGFVNNFFASGGGTTASTLPWYGIPADRQLATDLHVLSATAFPATPGATTSRGVVQYFRQATDRTAAFGPHLSQPTLTTVATSPSVRFRAQLPVQSEYATSWSAAFSQVVGAQGRSVALQMSAAYAGSVQTADLQIPDLSQASGWNPAWGLAQTSTSWSVLATGWTAPGGAITPVVEGGLVRSASQGGETTP